VLFLWLGKSEDGDVLEISHISRHARLVCSISGGVGSVLRCASILSTRTTSRCLCDGGSTSFGGVAWSSRSSAPRCWRWPVLVRTELARGFHRCCL